MRGASNKLMKEIVFKMRIPENHSIYDYFFAGKRLTGDPTTGEAVAKLLYIWKFGYSALSYDKKTYERTILDFTMLGLEK